MANLRDLGLSEYESRAYRTLLRSGSTTAKELSSVSDVPMGRVYDVLDSLESHDLVRCQAASRPKKYVAVEPDTALDRLLAERKRELNKQAEQYEETVTELQEELDATEPVSDRFWTVAIGPEESVDLHAERLAAADDRIRMAAGMPSPQLDIGEVSERVVTVLEDALDRGVTVTSLLTPELAETLPPGVRDRTARLAEHSSFAVRTHDRIDGPFNLIDSAEVCIEVPNPLDPAEAFALIDFKDAAFASDVRETFDERWERATPLTL
ncbi:TrmB family transcriptional regulator [Salinirarus marinus]|uniref:TrmB family transcriptional regulator n=1 Tax=Salinirarus marinus TaxID=3068310 RepID=UPI003C6C99FA